eukprot:SM000041S15502  [mRNA]  locus=s41:524511:525400:+ [translate_table: standard]
MSPVKPLTWGLVCNLQTEVLAGATLKVRHRTLPTTVARVQANELRPCGLACVQLAPWWLGRLRLRPQLACHQLHLSAAPCTYSAVAPSPKPHANIDTYDQAQQHDNVGGNFHPSKYTASGVVAYFGQHPFHKLSKKLAMALTSFRMSASAAERSPCATASSGEKALPTSHLKSWMSSGGGVRLC